MCPTHEHQSQKFAEDLRKLLAFFTQPLSNSSFEFTNQLIKVTIVLLLCNFDKVRFPHLRHFIQSNAVSLTLEGIYCVSDKKIRDQINITHMHIEGLKNLKR